MSIENELPEGWVETTLRAITKINPGVDVSTLSDSTMVSFVPMAAVEAETGHMDASKERELGEVRRGYTAFQEGDILFAKITPCMENGKFAIARSLASKIGFGSTEFHVLRPEESIDSNLILYYLVQQSFRQSARSNMTGSAGQLRVPAAFLANASYPLPPINEQRRIVAAIEQQFSRLDAAVTSLRHARAKLKRQRAAILKAAVEGTLTADWRAQHPASEKAEQLLQRILQERRAKWEAEQLAKMQAKGVAPKDNKWKEAYKEPEPPETTNLPELPKGWCWVSFGQCFEVHVGATPSRKASTYWGGDIPWISSGEVQFCHIRSTREHITEDGLNNSSTQINPIGSVLLGMIGEGRTRGQVAILDIEACNNQNCAAIWVSQTPVFTEFIYYWLWSQYEVTRRGSSGNNQPALNKTRIEEMVFPLVPISEQEQIVSEVEQRLSILTKTEEEVEANLKRAERLRQTILAQAFAGRLVPQDSRDEPASVLLERILHECRERDGMQKKGKAGNGRAMAAVRAPGEPVKIDVEGMEQVVLWETVGN